MDPLWKTILWQQFGAAIDMLENSVHACPDALWIPSSNEPAGADGDTAGFWYTVFHTLFYLDCYLSERRDGFTPPPPFTLDELDPSGLLPDRPYTKAELQNYLEHGRRKCRTTIDSMTDEKARSRCEFEWLDLNGAELLLYNMRHVQHHAAQMNLLLRQATGSAPRWVAKTKGSLSGT